MKTETIKIAKYISQAGVASRRKAEILVGQGLVFVNGKKISDVARRVDPTSDKITVAGKQLEIQKPVYYLLNKPAGYTCTLQDRHARKLIISLVPDKPKVWPVGRLDKMTSGLILLTNDGDITLKLTHPRHEIKKEYEIISNLPLTQTEIKSIQNGLKLEDGFIKPDQFEVISKKKYLITIHSGKKRVVRRIIEKVGKSVVDLKRVRISSLNLDSLPSGKYRELSPQEISRLLK